MLRIAREVRQWNIMCIAQNLAEREKKILFIDWLEKQQIRVYCDKEEYCELIKRFTRNDLQPNKTYIMEKGISTEIVPLRDTIEDYIANADNISEKIKFLLNSLLHNMKGDIYYLADKVDELKSLGPTNYQLLGEFFDESYTGKKIIISKDVYKVEELY